MTAAGFLKVLLSAMILSTKIKPVLLFTGWWVK
jgi:hypothetical protein